MVQRETTREEDRYLVLSTYLDKRCLGITPLVRRLQTFLSFMLRITMYTHVHENESTPLLCGFAATLLAQCPWRTKTP
jgi:hypothetical protein